MSIPHRAPLAPLEQPVPPKSPCPPSVWLRRGYAWAVNGQGAGWVYTPAYRPIEGPDDPFWTYWNEDLFARREIQDLIALFAVTFGRFIELTSEGWQADIRDSPSPPTLLRVWRTVLGVFNYYVGGKKLPPGGAGDYFWIILDYCNGGTEAVLRARHLQVLKPDRVKRVAAELERYFHPRVPCRYGGASRASFRPRESSRTDAADPNWTW